jgi:lantibiotic modifying enzyme
LRCRYRLLRGLPHLLLLLDGDKEDGSYNVFKQKKLKLDDVKKLFKQYPILVRKAFPKSSSLP